MLKAAPREVSGMTLALFVAESLFLGYVGWLLIFRTSTILRRAHNTYGFNLPPKPRYSTLMRSTGILIWLPAALADHALLMTGPH